MYRTLTTVLLLSFALASISCASSKKRVESDQLENAPPVEEAPLTARVLVQNRSRADAVAACHTKTGREGDGQAFVLLIVAPNGDVLDSYGFHPDQPTEAFQRCVGESLVGLRYGFSLDARGIFVQPLSVSEGGVVVFDNPTAGVGRLDPTVVQEMLDGSRSGWASCARGDTSGKAVVQFVIAPDGAVRMPAVSASTIADPSVERCLSNVARDLVFPRPEGGAVVVNYPIRF